jgi:gliding motility-associated-like protein
MRVAIFLCFLLSSLSTFASHIMGGEATYEYLGAVGNGIYQYRVKFTIYSNCDSQSQFPTPPSNIKFAVYQEGSDPNADKLYINEYTVNLTNSTKIEPDIPNDCTFGIDVCVFKAEYITVIELPIFFNTTFSNGYHLYFDVCCRNDNILNLNNAGFTGSVFYSFIPNPLIVNNSPVFSDNPLLFLCAGDTTPLLNTAFDPDGDLLVFSFQEPYSGYSSAIDPQPDYSPNPDLNPLNWPIPQVNWDAGFSFTNPFGSNGFAQINSFTGYTSYSSPSQGNYVVAVEIKEYRNGNLIGITRRDMQFIVVNCPPNIPPTSSNSPVNGQVTYQIEEGENLCFDIQFTDANNDFITLNSNGDIFNPSITNPSATINTPVSGTGNVTANFCWETSCGQNRLQPYLFTINAPDDGCPPKSTPEVYSILITEYQSPTELIGSDNVCSGQVNEIYTVNANSGSFIWEINGGVITSGQGSKTVSVNWGNGSLGELSVTPTSQFGCTGEPISKLININAINIDAGNDQIICAGESVMLGPVNIGNAVGFNYSWSPANVILNPTSSSPSVSPTVSTNFIVIADNGVGCTISDTVFVEVLTFPITVSDNNYVCEGSSIQIEATGGVDYIWEPNTNISSNTTSNPIVSPEISTTYVVTITDNQGCIMIDSVFIEVKALPEVSAGENRWLCESDTSILNASGATTYIWSPLTQIENELTPNPSVWPTDTTTYFVEGTDIFGCVNIDSVVVYVSFFVPTFAGNDTSICYGDSIFIGGNPTAPIGTIFSWNTLTELNDSTLSNPLVYPSITKKYWVTTLNYTCNGSDTILVTVNNPPNIDAGATQQICIGDSAFITASGGDIYVWSPNENILHLNQQSTTVWPTDTLYYFVEGTDNFGCKNIDSVLIIVNPLPVLNIIGNTIFCIGDTTELIVQGAENYIWSPNNQISELHNDTVQIYSTNNTIYQVLGIDSNLCENIINISVTVNFPNIDAGINKNICIGDSVLLIGTGGVTYEWSPNYLLSDTNNDSTYSFAIIDTIYYLTATDINGCIGYDSVRVNINLLPIVSSSGDTEICIGDSVLISATGALTYSWQPTILLSNPNSQATYTSPTNTSQYIVIGTDNNNCKNSDTLVVIVNLLPNIEAGEDVYSCRNENVVLGGNPTGPVGSSYIWTPNINLNDNQISNPIATNEQSITYYLTVVDTNGCQNSDSLTIYVFNLININDTSVCNNESIELNIETIDGVAPFTYVWEPSTGLNNSNSGQVIAQLDESTKYFVSVTDANNCMEIDEINIEVYAAPVVNFNFSSEPSCDGLKTTFENLTENGNEYLWTFNQLYTSSETNPIYTFPYSNNFSVKLFAINNNGCKDSLIIEQSILSFKDYVELKIPAIFTPNNDGINDIFDATNNYDIASCTDIKIYNRWGSLIYETKFGTPWDGTTNANNEVPEGVYFYIVNINGIVFNGSLSLRR